MATAPTSVTQSIVSESPEVEAYKLNLLKNASNLAYNTDANGNPVASLASQLPQYQIAGFAPNQAAALAAATNTGVGSFAPYVNRAQSNLDLATGATKEAADIARKSDTRGQFAGAQEAMQGAGQAAANINSGIGGVATGNNMLGQANALAANSASANMNPANAAIQGGIGGLQTAQQMAQNSANPNYGEALAGLGQAAGTVQGAVGTIASGQGQYDPNSASAYMNPYTQQVLQAQLGEMNRQSQMQQQANTSQATRAGAFGGDRAAIQQAETQRNNTQLQNQAIANSYGQNYGQAQQAAMSAYEQGQQRNLAAGQATAQAGQALAGVAGQQAGITGQQTAAQQQAAQIAAGAAGQQGQLGQGLGSLAINNAQLGQGAANIMNQGASTAGNLAGQQGNIYAQQASAEQALGQGIGSLAAQQYGIGQNMATTMGGLGGQLGNLGVQQAALGQTVQQMNTNDINLLYNTGQAQQAQNQQGLDATRANTLQQVYAPYQQAGFLSDIYKGAPSSQMQTSAASSPTASPFMQAVGVGIGGLAAATGAKKANLFG